MNATIAATLPVRMEIPPHGTGGIIPLLRGVPDKQLRAAYLACEDITRTRARNFYHGLKLTPEPRRSAIYSIYAWMRRADDEADAQADSAARRARLAEHRERTERILTAALPPAEAEAYWFGFAATVQSYPLDPQIFRDMLAGLEEDIAGERYANDAQLSRYCYRVASTAGLACVGVWGLLPGVDPRLAHELAVRRGQAFQRTNILRDFGQDYDATPRRAYIPDDALAEAGLTLEELRRWAHPDRCASLILKQAAIAREHYRASDPLEGMIDRACAPTLWAMTRIYSGILALIEANPRAIVQPARIRLRGTTKAAIALRAAFRARSGRW